MPEWLAWALEHVVLPITVGIAGAFYGYVKTAAGLSGRVAACEKHVGDMAVGWRLELDGFKLDTRSELERMRGDLRHDDMRESQMDLQREAALANYLEEDRRQLASLHGRIGMLEGRFGFKHVSDSTRPAPGPDSPLAPLAKLAAPRVPRPDAHDHPTVPQMPAVAAKKPPPIPR